MNTTIQQWNIPEGTDVIGADDHKVGKVVAAQDTFIVVEKGFFFPSDYYIPTTAIANYDGDKVYLTVTKDEALNQGWENQPVASDYSTQTGTYATGSSGYTDEPLSMGDRYAATASDVGDVSRGSTTEMRTDETLRVPVYEEELTATTRPVERGQVRITKEVITENRTIEVPVTEEKIRVDYRMADRDAAVDADAFQEGTIEIPIRGEEVDVQKRTRVAQEVEIGKETVQSTERVGGTVRKEDVRVEEMTGKAAKAARRAAAADAPLTDADRYPDSAAGSGVS